MTDVDHAKAKSLLKPISEALDGPEAKRPEPEEGKVPAMSPYYLDEIALYGGQYENRRFRGKSDC